MTLDWTHFTPWGSLAGGLLIGIAAALFILLNGRVAGVSGIVGGLLRPARGDVAWRFAFIAGLIGAPALYRLAAPLPQSHVQTGHGGLVLAGLLVGVGTRCAAGCTSGHGVCGLANLSLRSLAATASFMVAGFVTVFVMRHILA